MRKFRKIYEIKQELKKSSSLKILFMQRNIIAIAKSYSMQRFLNIQQNRGRIIKWTQHIGFLTLADME